MRLSLRFILPLFFVLAIVALVAIPIVEKFGIRWYTKDLDLRSKLIASTLNDSLILQLHQPNLSSIEKTFSKMIQDERLYALGLCSETNQMIYNTKTLPEGVSCNVNQKIYQLGDAQFHINLHPIETLNDRYGSLLLIHDMGFAIRRIEQLTRNLIYFFVLFAVMISVVIGIIVQWSWKEWIRVLGSYVRGGGLFKPSSRLPMAELRPVVRDLKTFIHDLESERRPLDESQVDWCPKALRDILNKDLAGDEVLVVSNRQPYIHRKKDKQVEVQVPASGLVTALEPIMRACSGTWIAHGSGNADRLAVDKWDHVMVPPASPSYSLRRVWLTKKEEAGYYYGFSNEGLWALCHIAHVRPIFRSNDWFEYIAVNEKFAKAVVDEAKTEDPVILVQDYHFALLPKMIRKKLPKATIITFWHIPFPNSEVFGICPWRKELLEGLLGSDIIGFHTRFHCNNFLESIDRFIESRIDREHSTVSFNNEITAIHNYPISIEYPVRWLETQASIDDCRKQIREINNFPENRILALGLDRLDYTKGIIERFLAVERLLELYPEWIGKFSLVQIAAPSRTEIDQYQRFEAEVYRVANQINRRFGGDNYDPICLKIEHHDPEEVFTYYRGVEVCLVTSLHDGMNLVAKEFVAAREDERGVLILSQFTGASRELPEALIVNPYDIDQCAYAIKSALEMDAQEQHQRMRSMRGLIKEFNVYRWAGRMLLDAAKLRQRNRLLENISNKPVAIALP